MFFTCLIHNSSKVDLLKHRAKTHCRRTDTVKEQQQDGKFQMKEYIHIYERRKGNIWVKWHSFKKGYIKEKEMRILLRQILGNERKDVTEVILPFS